MLSDLRDIATKDKVCVIAGNGPSLSKTPRKLLEQYRPHFDLDETYEKLKRTNLLPPY